MSCRLSDFVRLSPLEAALAVLLGRFRLPARYLDPDAPDDRIEPRIDEALAIELGEADAVTAPRFGDSPEVAAAAAGALEVPLAAAAATDDLPPMTARD